jgi:MATE family multidrug resistance protein
MVCFEWWALEILALFSGFISVPALASEIIIVNIVSFVFMMPLGISFAASTLTGNQIGEGNVLLAKRFAQLTILLNIILSLFIILLMSLFKTSLT